MSDSDLEIFPALSLSENETRVLGARYGRTLAAGDVVALQGNLGAGKTQFIKGICTSLGIEESLVSSPTFTVVNEYSSRIPVYHIDMYRIERLDEALAIGIEEYLFSDGICLIEWPEILEPLLPPDSISIRISYNDGDLRSFELLTPDRP